MTVSLVTYIPDDFVVRCIEYIMQSNCQFNYTKAGTKMTRIVANNINNELAQLCAYFKKIRRLKFSEIFRGNDF